MKDLRAGRSTRTRGGRAAGDGRPAPRQPGGGARGAKEKARRAAPDDRDRPSCHEGVKLEAEGLVREELDEGQLDAPPGLQFVRHGGVGAAFVLFWLLVSCLRGAAASGPARGGAARRGGGGAVVGGSATLGTCFTWRLLLFGANLRNVGSSENGAVAGEWIL